MWGNNVYLRWISGQQTHRQRKEESNGCVPKHIFVSCCWNHCKVKEIELLQYKTNYKHCWSIVHHYTCRTFCFLVMKIKMKERCPGEEREKEEDERTEKRRIIGGLHIRCDKRSYRCHALYQVYWVVLLKCFVIQKQNHYQLYRGEIRYRSSPYNNGRYIW